MFDISILPTVNASLNLISFSLLISGYAMMKRGNIAGHKTCMISAFVVSVFFLISYLTYAALGPEKRFGGTGWVRPVYFTILISHVSLAATVPVLASWTLMLGLRGRIEKHRRLARITFPIWVYVSMTGVVVYLLLFRLFGPARTMIHEGL